MPRPQGERGKGSKMKYQIVTDRYLNSLLASPEVDQEIVGWASSEDEAEEWAEELGPQASVGLVEDLNLFNNYWWPENWPGYQAWKAWLREEGPEVDSPEAWVVTLES